MNLEDRYYYICNRLIAVKQEFEEFLPMLYAYKNSENQSYAKRDRLETERFRYDTTIYSMTESAKYYENEMTRLGIQFRRILY